MSALPPKADMCGARAHVRYGPIADIAPHYELTFSMSGNFQVFSNSGFSGPKAELGHPELTRGGIDTNSVSSRRALSVTSWILEFEALRPDVFRLQTVIRLCQPLLRTALLARQPCARQFFGNCPIRVDSRFCRAHPYTDKSRRRDSHSTLEDRTELERPFEWRSPRSASNTSEGTQLIAWRPPAFTL